MIFDSISDFLQIWDVLCEISVFPRNLMSGATLQVKIRQPLQPMSDSSVPSPPDGELTEELGREPAKDALQNLGADNVSAKTRFRNYDFPLIFRFNLQF